jgi:hypothetical protein
MPISASELQIIVVNAITIKAPLGWPLKAVYDQT